MVLDFRVECVLDMDCDSYWRVKGTRGFFDFMVEDKALYKMSAEAEWHDPDGATHMKCSYIPRTVEIPDVVRALLGDTILEIIDTQTWNYDVQKHKLDFVITPTFLTDNIKTTGSTRVEPHEDPNKCLHIVEGKCEVNILWVWSFIEDALIKNLNKFYEDYPGHVARFRAHMESLVGEKATTAEMVDAYINMPDIHGEQKAANGEQNDVAPVPEGKQEMPAEQETPLSEKDPTA